MEFFFNDTGGKRTWQIKFNRNLNVSCFMLLQKEVMCNM